MRSCIRWGIPAILASNSAAERAGAGASGSKLTGIESQRWASITASTGALIIRAIAGTVRPCRCSRCTFKAKGRGIDIGVHCALRGCGCRGGRRCRPGVPRYACHCRPGPVNLLGSEKVSFYGSGRGGRRSVPTYACPARTAAVEGVCY